MTTDTDKSPQTVSLEPSNDTPPTTLDTVPASIPAQDTTTKPYGVIYVITCTVNGKQYVGQTTTTPTKRWKRHCVDSHYGKGHLIGRAIRKYGEGSFQVTTVDQATSAEDLDQKEIHWISTLGAQVPHGYNIRAGGSGMTLAHLERMRLGNLGRKLSVEAQMKMRQGRKFQWIPSSDHIERIRRALRGRKRSKKHGENLSRSLRGRKLSPEHIEKVRQTSLGRKQSAESVEKTRQANLGRKRSVESIEKMRQVQSTPEAIERKRRTHLGKKKSPEQIEKMRQANLGKKHSPEAKEKMSLSRKGKKQSPEHIEKCRLSRLGRKHSPEAKEKMRQKALGRKHTPESVEKCRQASLGRKLSPEHIERLRQANTGRKISPEVLDRLSKIRSSPEYKEKRRQMKLLRLQAQQAQTEVQVSPTDDKTPTT